MQTKVDEIADGIFRLSTFTPDLPPAGFTFNQYLIRADELEAIAAYTEQAFTNAERSSAD